MGVIHDKPAPHPAPWRWQPRTGNLEDANGNAVLWAMSTNSEDGVIGTDSDVVRALLAAAPEMEDLLRRALYETQPNGVCGDIHETDDWRKRMKALLDRIDATQKEGT